MIKVLLIDDHRLFLDSLSLLLRQIDSIEVVGVLSESNQVDAFLDNHAVDLLISDLHMPVKSGIDLTLHLKTKHPSVKILLLTMADDAIHIKETLKAGVHGYILKKSGRVELEKAISQIAAGKKYFSEEVIDELATQAGEDLNAASPFNIEHLTPREIDVLKLITQEYSTVQISEKLFVSVATIETHRANLMKKLQVKSSIGMVKYAISHGLID